VSTLAIAVEMTCMADDGKSNCTAAMDAHGKSLVVVGEGVKAGQKMNCEDRGNMINCEAMAVNMTCTSDDGNGNCTADVGTVDEVIAFTGEAVQTGDAVFCVIAENTMHCIKLEMP